MGIVHIMERGGSDYHDFKKYLKMASEAIDAICEITEEMEDEYGYSKRDKDDDWSKHERRRIR